MLEALIKIEKMLQDIIDGRDDMIPVERISHVLRVVRTQIEMQEEGLFDN